MFPYLELTEIYHGQDPKWSGWHNLILRVSDIPGDSRAIAGPIDPDTSSKLIEAGVIVKKRRD